MKNLTFLIFLLSTLSQAQGLSRNLDAIAYVDSKAPIGLDLMYGKKEGITVYPNASNDRILISVAGKLSEEKSFVIYNFSGQVVYRSGICHENTYMVDISGLKKDLYVVEVNSGKKTFRKKWKRS